MPIPKKDTAAIKIMARHLRRSPKSIEDLQTLMGISERTAYRWLKYLEEMGHDVVSRRKSKHPGRSFYSILPRRNK